MSFNLEQFNELRQAIVDILVEDETTISEAHFSDPGKFNGSPAAVVDISQNEALYHSSSHDKITFVFEIRLYIPLENNDSSEEVERRLGRAYWEVIHMFNQRGVLGQHATWVEPIPGIFSWEEREAGILRVATINLRCILFTKISRVLPENNQGS